jgi:hypothetical protein
MLSAVQRKPSVTCYKAKRCLIREFLKARERIVYVYLEERKKASPHPSL